MSDERLLSVLPPPIEDIEQAVADLAELPKTATGKIMRFKLRE